jgi:hypothetical protein
MSDSLEKVTLWYIDGKAVTAMLPPDLVRLLESGAKVALSCTAAERKKAPAATLPRYQGR